MTHLFIDDQAGDIDQSVHTWEDLLANLDAALDHRGRVLTEVQFDGVGEPTFREPEVLRRRLSGVGRIDAATATPADLLRDCLLEAAGTIAILAAESSAVAEVFRGNRPQDGQARLAGIADQMGQLLVLVQTLEGPLGVAVHAPGAGAAEGERLAFARLGTFVGDLITAHQSADYQTVADTLEYDVAPFLQSWQGRFEQLAG